MNQREDIAAGVYIVGLLMLTLLCLAAAFVLPGWLTSSRILGWIALLGLVAFPILEVMATRSRVHAAVAERGVLVP
jgi:hypothetical protein